MATPGTSIEDRIVEVLRQNDGAMTALEIAKKVGCTKKEINQKFNEMERQGVVMKVTGSSNPPKWQLCDVTGASPQPQSQPNRSQSETNTTCGSDTLDTPLRSLSLDTTPTATPTKQVDDGELTERVTRVLRSKSKAISAPDIGRELEMEKYHDVKRILYALERQKKIEKIAEGSKPLWQMKRNSTSEQATMNGEPLYTKEEDNGDIRFKKVSKTDVTTPPTSLLKPPFHQATPTSTCASSISGDYSDLESLNEIPLSDDDDEVKQKPQEDPDSHSTSSSNAHSASSPGSHSTSSPSMCSRSGKPKLAASFPPNEKQLQEEILGKLKKYPTHSFTLYEIKDMVASPTQDVVLYALDKLVECGKIEKVSDEYRLKR